MANNVASPLEKQFMQIAGLALVTSQNAQGSTSITLQFDLDKNIDTAVADVQSAISAASSSLPGDIPSQPTLKKVNPNDQAIIFIALASATLTSTQLYDYAYTTVGQQITILPGVSNISVFGTKGAVRIEVDLSKVASRGLTISDVVSDLQAQTQYLGAGQLDGMHQTLLLQPEGQLSTAEEYSKVILANASDGTPIYLRDIATVKDAKQDERIQRGFQSRGLPGKTSIVVTAVYRRAGANAI
jgi:HAE1 family hydrophobic/amphiphilic exporter-1